MGDNRFQSNAEDMFFSEEEKRYIEKYSEVFEEQKKNWEKQQLYILWVYVFMILILLP